MKPHIVTSTASKAEIAGALAIYGNGVFPLAPNSKVPTKGSAGFKDAIQDVDAAHKLFSRAKANVGFATGAGIVVIDVDGEIGESSLEAIETGANMYLPVTYTVQTPRGGLHLYYRYDPAVYTIPSAQNVPGKKIDVRADGGYVVAPHSTTDDGEYAIDIESGFRIVECPTWFLKLLEKHEVKERPDPKRENFKDFDRTMLDYISSDDRDEWLKIGMALHTTYGDDAFGAWQDWSSRSPKYEGMQDCSKTWDSFKQYEGNKVTVASVIHQARGKGWEPGTSVTLALEKLDRAIGITPETRADESPATLLEHMAALLPSINPFCWPEQFGKTKPHATARNITYGLEELGVEIRLNVLDRRAYAFSVDPDVEALIHTPQDRQLLTEVVIGRFAAANLTGDQQLRAGMLALSAHDMYNPFELWARAEKWDGVDRLDALADTVMLAPDQSDEVFRLYVKRWLVSVVAAANNFRYPRQLRGVLTFTGPQSAGKTMWFKSLMPEGMYAEGVQMDFRGNGKDSIAAATRAPVAELGELDATFRKADQASLKNFLSQSVDSYRPPYGREVIDFPRVTAYCATVNHTAFLRDLTGSSRFWPVDVIKLDWRHKVDIRQLWAQAFHLYDTGEPWHLSDEESAMRETASLQFMDTPPTWDCLTEAFEDFEPRTCGWYTVVGALTAADISITNISKSEAIAWLEKNAAEYVKDGEREGIRVRRVYKMPLIRGSRKHARAVKTF